MKRVFLTFMANLSLVSSIYAMDNPLEDEIHQIEARYGLSPQQYTESLREHSATAKKIVSEAETHGKLFGIVVGENHTAKGAKCLEMLLLPIAQSRNIQHCLIELTPKILESVINSRNGYEFGSEIGQLQRLILEAKRLGMEVTAIDKDTEEAPGDKVLTALEDTRDEVLTGLEDIKEMLLTGEDREKHFIEQILKQDKNFIYYTGANHLPSLYYNKELNERYSLIFINCEFLESEEDKKTYQRVIDMIKDESVSRIHAQREKFLTETDRSYRMPVMYNRHNSMVYRHLLQGGHNLYTVNLNEIREG